MERAVVATVLVIVVGTAAPGVAAAASTQSTGATHTQLEAVSSGDVAGDPVEAGAAVSTREQGASLEITEVDRELERPTVGQRQRFTVTVENDGTTPIKVESVSIIPKEDVEFRGPFAESVDFRVLDPGETLTVTLFHEFSKPGIKTLQVRVQGEERAGATDASESVDVRRTFTMEVLEPKEPVVEFDTAEYSTDVENPVTVTVTNPGQTPIRNVQLQMDGDVTVTNIDTRRTASIGAGESETFQFNVTTDSPGEKTLGVAMKYDAIDDRSRTVQQRKRVVFEEPDLPDIRVSSVEFSRDNTTVKIDGEVGNIGQTDAEGLSVGVKEADGVAPAAPQKTAIVGEVPQGEGRSFTLYATVEPGVESVPLWISYSSNGIDRTIEERVGPVPAVQQETTEEGEPVGASTLLFGGILLLGVLGFIGFAWYNADSDDDGDADTDGEAPTSGGSAGTNADDRVQSPGAQGGPGQGDGAHTPEGPQEDRANGAPQSGRASGPQRGRASGPQRGQASNPQTGHGGGQQASRAGGPRNGHEDGQQGGLSGDQHGAHAGGQQGSHVGNVRAGRAGDPREDGAGATTRDPGAEVQCDGCGDRYARDEVGSIAIADGETAQVCQDCQKETLMAAKRQLGARQDRSLEDGVDELVDATSGEPGCDGCGSSVSKDDLEAMTLPDGSSALACADCRDSALNAAREELTGRDR